MQNVLVINITVHAVMSVLILHHYTPGHLYYKCLQGMGSEHQINVFITQVNCAYYKCFGLTKSLHTIPETDTRTRFTKFLPYPLLYLSILRCAGPLYQ